MDLWWVKTLCIGCLLVLTLLCGWSPIKVSQLSSTNGKTGEQYDYCIGQKSRAIHSMSLQSKASKLCMLNSPVWKAKLFNCTVFWKHTEVPTWMSLLRFGFKPITKAPQFYYSTIPFGFWSFFDIGQFSLKSTHLHQRSVKIMTKGWSDEFVSIYWRLFSKLWMLNSPVWKQNLILFWKHMELVRS